MADTAALIDEVKAAEAARCAALAAGDTAGLAELLSNDLAHVHLHGVIDDKETYLEGVRDKFRFLSVERGPLHIRVSGDVAVMIGDLIQQTLVLETGKVRDVDAVTSQVWMKEAGAWRLQTCHNAVRG